MKKVALTTLLLLPLLLVSKLQAQVMVHSSNGIDFLYEVYDGPGGGYKVKLIIANNTGKTVKTSGDFRLDFHGGGWIKMGPSTISAYDEKQFVFTGEYKKYPEVKTWKTPPFTSN